MHFVPFYYVGGLGKKLVGGGVVVVARTRGEREEGSGSRRDGVRKQERKG